MERGRERLRANHASCGVHDAHVLEDGGAVVGDDNFTLGGLDHLVHSSWAERSPDGVGDSCAAEARGERAGVRMQGEGRRVTFGSSHVAEPDFHWLLIAL